MDKTIVVWDDLKGKEARGQSKDVDLGEVHEVGRNFIRTEKGTVKKETFYIPKYLVDGYDGDNLWFNITEGEKSKFQRDNAPTYEEYVVFKTGTAPPDVETNVRVIEKRD